MPPWQCIQKHYVFMHTTIWWLNFLSVTLSSLTATQSCYYSILAHCNPKTYLILVGFISRPSGHNDRRTVLFSYSSFPYLRSQTSLYHHLQKSSDHCRVGSTHSSLANMPTYSWVWIRKRRGRPGTSSSTQPWETAPSPLSPTQL